MRLMHEGCVACMVHEEGRVGGLVWCWRVWKRSPRRGARMRDVWVAGLMLGESCMVNVWVAWLMRVVWGEGRQAALGVSLGGVMHEGCAAHMVHAEGILMGRIPRTGA